jgi:hypothetical protein
MIQSRLIQLLKKAIDRREKMLGIKTKKSAAISLEQLENLCKNAQSYNEIVLAAAAITGFFNLHRGGEIISPEADEETLKQPYAQDVCLDTDGIRYVINSMKTQVYTETECFLRKQEVPDWAWEVWLRFLKERNSIGHGGRPDIFVLSTGKIATALSKHEKFGYAERPMDHNQERSRIS